MHAFGAPGVGGGCVSDFESAKEAPTLDAEKAGVLDHSLTKVWAVRLAFDAAITVLRVDQIIMARPAGGPAPSKKESLCIPGRACFLAEAESEHSGQARQNKDVEARLPVCTLRRGSRRSRPGLGADADEKAQRNSKKIPSPDDLARSSGLRGGGWSGGQEEAATREAPRESRTHAFFADTREAAPFGRPRFKRRVRHLRLPVSLQTRRGGGGAAAKTTERPLLSGAGVASQMELRALLLHAPNCPMHRLIEFA